ncbi:R-PTPc-A-E-1 domain containing protein [Candidatus Nanopelagicaceae bacterium]
MNFRRSFRLLVIAISVTALVAPSAQATLFPGFPQGGDRQALSVEDLVENPFSFIVNNPVQQAVWNGTAVETPELTKFCDEFNTHGCNLGPDADLSVNSILPTCRSIVENCIDGLEFTKPDGTVVVAKFNRYFKGKTFSGLPELGMPGGSRSSLWDAPGVTNSGGTDQYVVNAKVRWIYSKGSARVTNFNASVFAVKGKNAAGYKEPGIVFGPAAGGIYASITDTGEITFDGTCVATEVGYCAERVEFSPGTRVKLVMKLSNKVTGWLHGRIAKPEITVTPINDSYNTLSVAADSVDVPMMYAQFNKSEMTKEFVDGYNNRWSLGRGLFETSFWRQFYPENPFASTIVTTLAESVKNTATEVHSYWNLSSIQNNSDNKCMSDTSKLVGFVTTNAMAYSGNAPTWDGESLQYKVAGLHFLPDGKTLTSGSYDLAMRSDTARCLYGFTNAPISASISVTSADGEQKVATTVLNEKNGWLYLAAYGFSFSAPTIKIKLSQEKPKEVAPTPTPTPSETKSAVKTIKCAKGKTVKTVKGVKPKCPAGYKAK